MKSLFDETVEKLEALEKICADVMTRIAEVRGNLWDQKWLR